MSTHVDASLGRYQNVAFIQHWLVERLLRLRQNAFPCNRRVAQKINARRARACCNGNPKVFKTICKISRRERVVFVSAGNGNEDSMGKRNVFPALKFPRLREQRRAGRLGKSKDRDRKHKKSSGDLFFHARSSGAVVIQPPALRVTDRRRAPESILRALKLTCLL